MTELTADEITTFAELFGKELTLAQMTHLEEWVTTHRAEAIVMHELGTSRRIDAYRADHCHHCQTAPIENNGLCRFCLLPEETP